MKRFSVYQVRGLHARDKLRGLVLLGSNPWGWYP